MYRASVRGTAAGWRWAVCALLVALFVAFPFAVRYAPVAGGTPATTDAATLLGRIRASASQAYSGYAESTGTLALPSTDQLDDVATLLSGRTQVRVWWRSADDWRSDTITPVGERSTRTTPAAVSLWDFEDNRVTVNTPEAPGTVRLPADTDTLPPPLAARLLSDATTAEVSSLAPRRVAGRAADGLRLTPSDALSSIGHVDVWADRASGVPLLVEAFGRTGEVAAMSSTFLDFTDAAPTDGDLAFTPPPGARVRQGTRYDLVRDVARSSGGQPPAALLGFTRAAPTAGREAIGEYGRGVTQVAVAALPERLAGPLRDQVVLAANATKVPEGIALSVGPIGLLLTDPSVTGGKSWLVAGTLTTEGLTRAAAELGASS